MDFFTAMEITASGLHAERTRMNLLASNMANARTTRTADGGPYKRLDPVFRAVPLAARFENLLEDRVAQSAASVQVDNVVADPNPPQRVFEPQHPDADASGFISLPNINTVQEMVNMITASRAYEAGVTVMQTIKGMARSALSIGG